MTDAGFGVYWRAAFLCPGHPTFLGEHAADVLDALAPTALWSEFDVYGKPRARGRPFKGTATIKKALRAQPVLVLARGDRDATVARDTPTARLTIEPQAGALALTAIIRGASLDRLGPRALTDVAEVITQLTVGWRPHAFLIEAWATPLDVGREFTYPRVRPPQVTSPMRAMGAIADVLDPTFVADDRTQAALVATQALAIAEVPASVVRTERDRVVTLRWVADPRDREAVAAACTRHEGWLLSLLPAKTAAGWTDDGDERLGGYPVPAQPPIALLLHDTRDQRDLRHAHVAIDGAEDGEITTAGWSAVAPLAKVRTLPDGTSLDEVRLLAPSRPAALALRARARAAGFDRVVYRDQRGDVWDPDPPGPWND